MNTAVESVRKPVRLVCIFFGIGIREGQQQEWWIFRSDTRLREDPCVLYDEFIVQTVEFFF
jgi:hypothetical protein